MDQTTFRQLLDDAVNKPGTVSAAYHAFYGYSIGNQIHALMQCRQRGITPGPIATFPGWKAKGRYVKRGEKALTLCMPITCKRRDASTSTTSTESNDEFYTRFVYRPNWFVLAQTDGADIAPIETPEWQADRALAALDVVEVPYDMADGNCQGYAVDRSIAVSPIAFLPHKTRFHELAHILLGHTTERATLSDSETTPRSLREVEAECVALVCCEALGLPGADESRGYIQHWNAQRGAEPISERSAQRIFKAADQILRAGRPAETKGNDNAA